MARRIQASYQSTPVSHLAAWSRHVALFALVATIVSVIVVRFGFLEFKPALTTFFGSLACAGLSILLAVIGLVSIWFSGARGIGSILLALVIDCLLLAYPAYLAVQYKRLPAIYDVTTDPIDPPKFDALARLRTDDSANSPVYAGLYSAELQRQAYPDIEPVQIDVTPQKAYDIALAIVTKRKWRIVDARPPQPPRREGHIEAVAGSAVMGFREDVAVRVLPDGDGSRVDLRSSSRYFNHDLGANAARVTALMDDINVAADSAKPAQKSQPAPAKAQAKAPAKR